MSYTTSPNHPLPITTLFHTPAHQPITQTDPTPTQQAMSKTTMIRTDQCTCCRRITNKIWMWNLTTTGTHTACSKCVDSLGLRCVTDGCVGVCQLSPEAIAQVTDIGQDWGGRCNDCLDDTWGTCSARRGGTEWCYSAACPSLLGATYACRQRSNMIWAYDNVVHAVEGLQVVKYTDLPDVGYGKMFWIQELGCYRCSDCIRDDRCARCGIVSDALKCVCARGCGKYCEDCVALIPPVFNMMKRDIIAASDQIDGYNPTPCRRRGGPYCFKCFTPGENTIQEASRMTQTDALQICMDDTTGVPLPRAVLELMLDFLIPTGLDTCKFTQCELHDPTDRPDFLPPLDACHCHGDGPVRMHPESKKRKR
jgi:hypothetical protein